MVSLANPSAPTPGGERRDDGIQRDIAVQGSIAYVADQMGRLVTVDVATPSAPQQLGAVVIGRYTFNVAVAGATVIHSANSAAYMDMIDVTTPASPVVRRQRGGGRERLDQGPRARGPARLHRERRPEAQDLQPRDIRARRR